MTVCVGIDVGTTAVKAIAVTPTGEVVARTEHAYPVSAPRPGWSEQDPRDWWAAAERALSELGARDAVGIGLSGQMHGLVALDDAGDVLRPAILWNDQRTGAECVEIEQLLGLERLLGLTGNRAFAGFTAPKLLWLRRHEPATFASISRILLPKDYVRLRLTGEPVSDVTDASGTLLLDVSARRWSSEMLDALALPATWLPPVLESPAVSGATPDGVPVAAGAGDCAAAALGVGICRPGVLSVVLGTSGVAFSVLRSFAPEPQARLHVFCHAVPGSWHAMGVMLSAAGALQWFRDVAAPSVPFAALLDEAEAWQPGIDGLLFLPYLSGERTPHADPDARGAFVGLELRHDRGALTRAVLEGVAFGLRDSLELLRGLGVEVESVRISGGGARSPLWRRIVASVLGLTVETTTTSDGSAFGAALLGGVAAGIFTDVDDAVARCVHVVDTVEPDPSWAEAYAEIYPRYRLLYPTLSAKED